VLGISTSYFIQHLVDSVLVRNERRLLNALGIGMVLIVLVLGSKNPRLPGDHFQYVGVGVAAVEGSKSPGRSGG
jgi:hypothetical protein